MLYLSTMKKTILYTVILALIVSISTGFGNMSYSDSLNHSAFQNGEWFKLRIHYGIFNASYATINLSETTLDSKPVYHIKGKGKSTGMLHWFFKVDDRYETYIDRNTVKPYRFIRDIDEGGYKKDIQIDFNYDTHQATVNDKKRKKVETISFKESTQDMMSAFYYLRNIVDHTSLTPGDEFNVPMFFDKENFDFKLKFLERDTIRTKFGKAPALKFRPYVMSGRVFKEKESLTVWISDDRNKIPLKLKAKLAVGSLTASLDDYKGLKHPFNIITKKKHKKD